MGKRRDRENPCEVCGHYHNHEAGETCGICGHQPVAAAHNTQLSPSAFPSEILPEFLFLGSYDHSARTELLKNQVGITHALNTVPGCRNMNAKVEYHCLPESEGLDFEDAINFLEKCEKENGRVLVYCMTGKSRSPAVVMAYLMKTKGWRFEESFRWVKERRTCVELNQVARQQLLEFETKVFNSSVENVTPLVGDLSLS